MNSKNIIKVSIWLNLLFFLIGYLCSVSTAIAGNHNQIADDFRIMRHQGLKGMRFSKRLPSAQTTAPTKGEISPAEATSAEQDEAPADLSFDAFGRKFDLELETNEHMLDNLPKALKGRLKQSIQIYKGRIAGNVDSWVRINREGERITGAFWDGSELYMIDNSKEVSAALDKGMTPRMSKQPYTLIYRLSDTETVSSCALDAQAKPLNSISSLVGELKALAQSTAAQAAKKLDVAIVTDAEFTQANSANPQAAVIERMNVVDGIYQEQVGVHLNITQIRPLISNGSLSSTSPGTLLDQFVSYTTSAGFNNPGITHLFTGRNLDGSTIGIAYIDVLCDKNVGVGLSQTSGTGTAGALTVAHEIGHNFGAPHDNQSGSACATESGSFIMNPVLNGSTQFSNCSLQQMAGNIANARCMTDNTSSTPTADIRPVIPTNPINATVGSNFKYVVEVRNSGSAAAQNSTAKISVPTALAISSATPSLGQCSINSGVVNCTLGSLAANAVNTITLNLKASNTAANLTSNVQVGASNDSNTTNNTANVAISITAPIIPTTTQGTIFKSDFNVGTGGFVYADNSFRGANQAYYESGSRVVDATGNGQLVVTLGGRDNVTINGMSGGWRKTFTLSAASTVNLVFEFKVVQTPNYEADEYSEALLSLDGRLIGYSGADFLTRFSGNGEGGSIIHSGKWKIKITKTLSAGSHTFTFGGFNNRKTNTNESTQVFIDNVTLTKNP